MDAIEKAAVEVPGDARNALDIDKKVHARILRKLDWYLFPPITFMYLFSVLDRSNIGNAKIAGMATDLDLVGFRYNTVGAIFFVPYILGQVPSNVALKLLRPSRWIPALMVVWGLVTTLTCLVKTYPELLVTRVFLGLAESGVFPGMTYYISLWYPRAELAKRIAIFSSAATVAGALSGILAYAIEKMEGIGGLHGWQWIFCLEGIATVLVALAALFIMHDYPETASFLTETEQCYIVELIKTDSQGLATHYNFRFVLQALMDYKTYVQIGILICFSAPGYAISLFTPTIINELGLSVANSQLLSVPPYAAGCVCSILVGIYSDRHQLRGPYVIAGAVVGIVGCVTLYTQTKPGAALVGVVLAVMGIFPCVPVILAWTSSNAGGDFKRGVAIAMVNGLANLGGLGSSYIFFDPPRFHVGLEISMALMSFSILLTSFAMWDYNRINKQKERFCSEHGITHDHKDQFRDDGDDSPLFRYML
ncbi:major facilitator superfamily domain-containing protein [Boletus coccyginus]|nr:major facilitator superfamily domain-containing protein [Boletus coccyginus]